MILSQSTAHPTPLHHYKRTSGSANISSLKKQGVINIGGTLIHIQIYIHLYIYIFCLHLTPFSPYTPSHTYTYIPTHLPPYTFPLHTHTPTLICKLSNVHTYTPTHTHLHSYTHTYTPIHTYTYTYTSTHTYAHTYTHTYTIWTLWTERVMVNDDTQRNVTSGTGSGTLGLCDSSNYDPNFSISLLDQTRVGQRDEFTRASARYLQRKFDIYIENLKFTTKIWSFSRKFCIFNGHLYFL